MKSSEMNAPSQLFFGSLVAFAAFALRRRSAPPGEAKSEAKDAARGLATASTSAAPNCRSWLDRVDAFFWRQEMRANDAYLSEASNVYDLEARMRDISRRVGSRYF